jgi:hypothetical protein
MPHSQSFVSCIHIGENYISPRALDIRPIVFDNSTLLCQQALGMSPKPDIRCETACCSISCTDAALPPQEVSIDMLLFHDSHMYTVIVSISERNGGCILRTKPLTNDRPTKFKDPDVAARYICVRGLGVMSTDKKQSFNFRSGIIAALLDQYISRTITAY